MGNRWESVQHARLRLGCSSLNSHLFHCLKVIDNEDWQCGAVKETPNTLFKPIVYPISFRFYDLDIFLIYVMKAGEENV